MTIVLPLSFFQQTVGVSMLGIIGGMGPLATADFMRKLTVAKQAQRDQDHVPALVWSLPQIPDRSDALIHGGASPLPALVACARGLRRAGARIGVMPCNTAHHWADEISAQSGLPLLHIAAAAVDALAAAPRVARTVSVLGTEGTHRSGFYDAFLRRAGFVPLPLGPAALAAVQSAVRAIKAGRLADAADIVERQLRHARETGADAIILACTELPLVAPCAADTLDATLALAQACVRWHEAHGGGHPGDEPLDSNHNDNDSLYPPGALGPGFAPHPFLTPWRRLSL